MPRTPPTTAGPEGLPEPPDFTLLSKSISDDTSFCSNLYSFSNTASYESLLLPRVPSPSLRLEEMLGLWPSTPKPTSAFGIKEYRVDDRRSDHRDSLATIVDFGDWISDQSQSRSPSLLPPAPLFHRHEPSLPGASTRCRLSSTNSDFPPNIKPTTNLALTNAATTEPKNNEISYSSPEPTQSERSDREAAPSAFEGEDVHDDSSNADMQLHQLAASPTEVSYIDWDDDDGRRGPSRIARVKKSLADLRAAERFIADVTSAKKTVTSRDNHDVAALQCSTIESGISTPTPADCRQQMARKHADRPLPDIPVPIQSMPQGGSVNVDAQSTSKVKKRSGHKCRLAKYAPQNAQCLPSQMHDRRGSISSEPDSPLPMSMPSPTIQKRKRISSVSFKSGRSEKKKKKSRLGTVGKLVRAVLRLKKDH
ncbi:hypothetical protein LTR96_004234 [Exophiala xenobiotica]|nr:hypothetical protein LTR96_004234 [Exophiala xenobiotica]KAK5339847.1 hypothetical protein LTR98_004649 [Exophiala xenobiotica]KAK5415509.1 hypothetical protein LTR06_003559 [Exophiala xenobiotica]